MVEGEVHRVWPMSACGATHTCGAGAYTGVSAVDWTQPQASQPAVDADGAHAICSLSVNARNGFGCGPRGTVMQRHCCGAVVVPLQSAVDEGANQVLDTWTALAGKHMVCSAAGGLSILASDPSMQVGIHPHPALSSLLAMPILGQLGAAGWPWMPTRHC